MRNMKKRSTLVLMIVCLLIVSISYCVLAQEKQVLTGEKIGPWDYISSGEEWEPVTTTTYLGVLKGSFYEMGFQYGQRAAYGTTENSDAVWAECLESCDNSIKEVKARLAKYLEQLNDYSPQTVEFLKGMADGAAVILDKSPFAKDSTNFERVFSLNVSSALTAAPGPAEGCNGAWIGKEATKDGRAVLVYEGQGGNMGNDRWGRKAVFIAVPDDPKAHVVFCFTGTGCIGRGGILFNDAGVVNSLFASDSGDFPETKDYGVEFHVSRFHAAFYGDSAEKAAEIVNLGSPEYREKTGRKTVLRTRGVVLMFGDANIGLVGEYTAKRYAVRRPGDMGETNSAYIAQANHNYTNFSMDENNEKTDIPMTKFAPEVKDDSSYYRFWSPMWYIRNNYGKLDLEMVLRGLAPLHDRYDKDGNKYGYERGKTFCTHKFNTKTGDPGGSHGVAVVVPETLEVYNIPCWPCRFVDQEWNYYNLNDYLGLR